MNPTTNAATRERHMVVFLTLAGATLRFWSFGKLGLTHFDEGIYAISGLWAVGPGRGVVLDPGVIPYAPPGFPLLVGIAYLIFGVSDGAAILAATVCGVATIPLAAWVGKRTFGPGAGVAAAAVATFSLVGIAFSRKALTDIPFLVCWLAALGLASRFLERPGLGRAVALGIAVGLVQYFKYNGWLTGLITVLAALAGCITNREERRPSALLRTFGFGFLAALIAMGIYLPWLLFVEQHGGYAGLLRHHRSYLGGIASWVPHWNAQLAQEHALSGLPLFPALAWGVGWSAITLLRQPRPISVRGVRHYVVGLLVGSILLGVSSHVTWWFGLAACGGLLSSKDAPKRVLGAWWLLLAVLTPFYHPYARLWLPIHAAGWIVLAGVLTELDGFGRDKSSPQGAKNPRVRFGRVAIAVACVTLAAIQQALVRPSVMPSRWIFEPAPSLREAAFILGKPKNPEQDSGPIVVLARRPMAYYLHLGGRSVQLAEGVSGLLRPPAPGQRAIVDGALVVQDGELTAVFSRLERFWVIEEQFTEDLDPVTLLDVNPAAAGRARPKRGYPLWRLAPRRPARPAPSS